MGRHTAAVLYVLAMVVVVVGVDVLFFRDHLWERLMVNVGIVLVFGAFYLRLRQHQGAQPPETAHPAQCLEAATGWHEHAQSGYLEPGPRIGVWPDSVQAPGEALSQCGCHTGVIGVALTWHATSSGTARGEARKGFVGSK
jgi:hypothetical protein